MKIHRKNNRRLIAKLGETKRAVSRDKDESESEEYPWPFPGKPRPSCKYGALL